MLLRDLFGWCLSIGIMLGLIGNYTHTSTLTVNLLFTISFLFGLYLSHRRVI